MSTPNDLLGQKVCHCLDQGRTLKAISMMNEGRTLND